IINNTQQKPEWHNSPNHTLGDPGGRMLVTNGGGLTFYQHIVAGNSTFAPGSYSASLYLMNVNQVGVCSPNPLLPKINFRVEFNTAATGTTGWVELQSVAATGVAQSANPTWVRLGGVFALPQTAARIRLTLVDNGGSGCGNDFAIDDIQFATCPSGGPLPVRFLGINAVQKGAGVNVSWSTGMELDNQQFEVQRSVDGNEPWTTVSSERGMGNSAVGRNYLKYDATPIIGYNFYRIKQTDFDGNARYSLVASVKVGNDKTTITVLNNPFNSNIKVDFISDKNATVFAKLVDATGRQVSTAKWILAKGRNQKSFDNVANLNTGMYIFTVTDETGNVLFNNKMIKQ
ncbi:MAG: T9SS type A sorting domain-containing protein, partial [Pedobacter sp.]